MGCLLTGLAAVLTVGAAYLITALIVKIAAMIFGFAFSWAVVLSVFVILVLLEILIG